MCTRLKLTGLKISFPLSRPLDQNSRFSNWLSHASKDELRDLFVRSMANEKVLYRANTGQDLKISIVVMENLQFLATLAGYSTDLYEAAKTIADEKNYEACPTEPQILPMGERDHVVSHRGRNSFARYDGVY